MERIQTAAGRLQRLLDDVLVLARLGMREGPAEDVDLAEVCQQVVELLAGLLVPRRVTVEVLNASGVDGLARVGMARLRRVGLDVVGTGNATAAQREAGVTMVLIRRGDSTGGGRVLAAYPKAMVRDEPSSTPLVDLTMVLGSDVVKRRKP